MKNKYIKDLMINIQMEYLDILKTLSEKMTMDNVYLLIDEIKQFWIKKEMKIEFIIENILENNNITFFTAATVLDLSGGDQFPFLLCGEYHIFDDPLFAHLENANLDLGSYSQFLYEKAIITINDNIEIIENYSNLIWVVPIRLLYSSIDKEYLRNNIDNMFVSLFNSVLDINDYFSKCKTIEDIEKHFNPRFLNAVHLTDNEKYGMTLREKIDLVKEEKTSKKLNAPNDAVLFFIALGGLMGQAIDIVYTSNVSRLIPFIRYEPSYHTIMSIMNNFKKLDKQFIDMETKITQYYLTQLLIDKNDFIGIDLNKYNNSIEKLQIRQKLNNLEIKTNQKGLFQKVHDEIEEILLVLKKDLLPPTT